MVEGPLLHLGKLIRRRRWSARKTQLKIGKPRSIELRWFCARKGEKKLWAWLWVRNPAITNFPDWRKSSQINAREKEWWKLTVWKVKMMSATACRVDKEIKRRNEKSMRSGKRASESWREKRKKRMRRIE